MFTKVQDKVANCSHRIAQDGLNILYPFLNKDKILKVTGNEFELIIKCDQYLDISKLEENTIGRLDEFPSGCVVLEYTHSIKQDYGTFKDLCIPFSTWKGKSTIRPFVNKDERLHYMRIFGFDLSHLGKRFFFYHNLD